MPRTERWASDTLYGSGRQESDQALVTGSAAVVALLVQKWQSEQ